MRRTHPYPLHCLLFTDMENETKLTGGTRTWKRNMIINKVIVLKIKSVNQLLVW